MDSAASDSHPTIHYPGHTPVMIVLLSKLKELDMMCGTQHINLPLTTPIPTDPQPPHKFPSTTSQPSQATAQRQQTVSGPSHFISIGPSYQSTPNQSATHVGNTPPPPPPHLQKVGNWTHNQPNFVWHVQNFLKYLLCKHTLHLQFLLPFTFHTWPHLLQFMSLMLTHLISVHSLIWSPTSLCICI